MMTEALPFALVILAVLAFGLWFSEHAHQTELEALKEKHAREMDALEQARPRNSMDVSA